MRLPKTPPDFLTALSENPEQAVETFGRLHSADVRQFVRSVNDKYLHWDKVRHRPMPAGLTPTMAWVAVCMSRDPQQQPLPLTFSGTWNLTYWLPPQHQEWVSTIDKQAGGSIGGSQGSAIPEDNERYLFNSLMEEAIASSQIEGACTTREVGKELLRTNRAPRDRAEQMILNNYKAILEIREVKGDELTPELLLHLQEVLTRDTLDDEGAAGRFRLPGEDIVVADVATGEAIYTPPPAETVEGRIRELCAFANEKSSPFVHPVVKAMALHFAIGFIHPFVDGNGRTARALFYWYMLKSGYWLFEYLPISRIIVAAPKRYALAYLYTETDRGDLTYFNHYHLDVVIRALNGLHEYLARQQRSLAEVGRLLQDHPQLNHRQSAMMGDAMKRPSAGFTVKEYEGKYRIAYNTANADLKVLVELGLLTKRKRPEGGKGWVFQVAPDIRRRLKNRPEGERPAEELTDMFPSVDIEDEATQKDMFEDQ